MEYFVGLDVSLEETAVCVVDATGRILGEAKVPSEPEAIAGYLLETGFPLLRVGLEACPLSQWLYDGLEAAGLPAICIEVRHLKAALSAMTNKTDRNNAHRGCVGEQRKNNQDSHNERGIKGEQVKMTRCAYFPTTGRCHERTFVNGNMLGTSAAALRNERSNL